MTYLVSTVNPVAIERQANCQKLSSKKSSKIVIENCHQLTYLVSRVNPVDIERQARENIKRRNMVFCLEIGSVQVQSNTNL